MIETLMHELVPFRSATNVMKKACNSHKTDITGYRFEFASSSLVVHKSR
jgi:hypothetical protein